MSLLLTSLKYISTTYGTFLSRLSSNLLVLPGVSLGASADLRCANVAICIPADEESKTTSLGRVCDALSPMVGHVEIRTLSLADAIFVA